MSIDPDSPVELQDRMAEKVSQKGRQLLSVTGWLVLAMAVILALRPSAFPVPLNFNIASSASNTNLPASNFANHLNVSIGLVFLAGFVSFLSPCVLPILPGYLTYLAAR